MANLEHAEADPKHVKMSGETPAVLAQDQPLGGTAAAGIDAGPDPCSIPSFAAACELMSAPYSCLVMSTRRRHVALPPAYLNKKRTGLRQELEGELLRFSQSLEGVPLAYDNVRILGHRGDIYDDVGYIHMNIEADFILFVPRKGQKLLGKVNKLGVSHVGCLVHGCFNASIPRPNLVPVETWRDAGPRIGAELEFEVMALDADTAGVLLIRGRLDRTRVQELLALGESSESSIPADQTVPPDAEPTEEAPDETPKKKKKKKKDKVKEENIEEEVTAASSCQPDGNAAFELNGTTDEVNGNEVGEQKKKKKKKKEKRQKEEADEVRLTPVELHGSDSSGYHSDKFGKKRKKGAGSEVAPGFSESPELPKSKKRRKSDVA